MTHSRKCYFLLKGNLNIPPVVQTACAHDDGDVHAVCNMCTYTNNRTVTDNLKLIPASTVAEIRTCLGKMSQCILCNTQEKKSC